MFSPCSEWHGLFCFVTGVLDGGPGEKAFPSSIYEYIITKVAGKIKNI
jgi:hypothetical protein